ncbi:MAG TPA: hypothetical protein VE870_12210 [Bacteroidales bacterium]|nr:hypothetical protein [Bacteroidales bacterium]
MKTLIYISGIIGGLLIVYWFSGIYQDPANSIFYLFSGVALICLVCLPLYYIDASRQKKKAETIIKSYGTDKEAVDSKKGQKSPAKGWSMNNSPFRDRKSGLSWGGGNIHAANASRGKRRNFGKK